jgi:Domain of unknown function (DUF6471)
MIFLEAEYAGQRLQEHADNPSLRYDGQEPAKGRAEAAGIDLRSTGRKADAIGARETERNLNNRITRAGFTAAFFLQCLTAIGVQTLRLEGG